MGDSRRDAARHTTRCELIVLFMVCLGSIIINPSVTVGEMFFDAYGGVASTESDDVSVENVTFPLLGPVTRESETRSTEFDSSFTVGARAGYWMERYIWLGGAVDASYFSADGDNVDISVGTLSFLIMLRWPLLTSEEFSKGRLQPYLGVGPSIFFADLSADFRPAVSRETDDFVAELGLDLRPGVAWLLNPRWALFAEYRFTHFSPDSDIEAPFPLGLGTDESIKTTLSTHHFLGGVSLRF